MAYRYSHTTRGKSHDGRDIPMHWLYCGNCGHKQWYSDALMMKLIRPSRAAQDSCSCGTPFYEIPDDVFVLDYPVFASELLGFQCS